VARNGWLFTELAASVDRIEDWLDDLCSVTGWLKSGAVVFETPVVDGRERHVPTAQAFDCYLDWAKNSGFRPDQIVARNAFTTRVNGSGLGPKSKHTNTGAVFLNLGLRGYAPDARDDIIILEDRKPAAPKAAAG
jgi:hypothetical protein